VPTVRWVPAACGRRTALVRSRTDLTEAGGAFPPAPLQAASLYFFASKAGFPLVHQKPLLWPQKSKAKGACLCEILFLRFCLVSAVCTAAPASARVVGVCVLQLLCMWGASCMLLCAAGYHHISLFRRSQTRVAKEGNLREGTAARQSLAVLTAPIAVQTIILHLRKASTESAYG
jgi:hypothetical protein